MFISLDFQVISLLRKRAFCPKFFLLRKSSQYSTTESWLLSKKYHCSSSGCFFIFSFSYGIWYIMKTVISLARFLQN